MVTLLPDSPELKVSQHHGASQAQRQEPCIQSQVVAHMKECPVWLRHLKSETKAQISPSEGQVSTGPCGSEADKRSKKRSTGKESLRLYQKSCLQHSTKDKDDTWKGGQAVHTVPIKSAQEPAPPLAERHQTDQEGRCDACLQSHHYRAGLG